MRAAVSLVLRSGAEIEVLLIRRAEADGDPWSGHMALPGGRQDPSDLDLLHTAMRETLEETGVDLQEKGVALGRLDPLEPATYRLPPLSILPFVFDVPAGTDARPASPEVVQIFWVPLSLLCSPEASGTVEIPLEGGSRTFPCFRVEGNVVWGLTYRILRELERLF
jgi:8-oxo-dGTP pyrophosphatase MutT (NUDIX family)